MSYGEPTLSPDYGRFVDLVNEVSTLNTESLFHIKLSAVKFVFAYRIILV